jgi:hypothetical protein
MKPVRVTLILALLIPSLAAADEQHSVKKLTSPEPTSALIRTQIDQIRKMEDDRIQAGVRKDIAAIAAVTADDCIQIDWNGKVLNKAAVLARIKSSNIVLQSNTLKGSMNGNDISGAIRYSRVYVNTNGHWQVVAFQQTPVVQH